MDKLSKQKLKKIKEVQGNKYMHNVLEEQFQTNVVLPEIARQKQIVDEQREQLRKQYEEIQKQRRAYSKALSVASDVRKGGSRRSDADVSSTSDHVVVKIVQKVEKPQTRSTRNSGRYEKVEDG